MAKTFNKLIRRPSGAIALLLVGFWIIVALLAPLLAPPADPDNAYMMARHGFSSLPKPADAVSLWGTTSGGYDIY